MVEDLIETKQVKLTREQKLAKLQKLDMEINDSELSLKKLSQMLAETSDKLRDRSDQVEDKRPKLGQIRRRTARILEQIEQEKKDQKMIVT